MEDKNIINRTGRHTKIAILWVAVMCGLTLHSLADLMPLFWNEAIAISETGHAPEGLLTFMMSISYLVPVLRYYVNCSIGRAAIYNKIFQIWIILIKNTFNTLLQMLCRVITNCDNTYLRVLFHCLFISL